MKLPLILVLLLLVLLGAAELYPSPRPQPNKVPKAAQTRLVVEYRASVLATAGTL